jgi:hypothetical protein
VRIKVTILETPYRCHGKCGNGEICADIVYFHGYCVDPPLRTKAVEDLKSGKAVEVK